MKTETHIFTKSKAKKLEELLNGKTPSAVYEVKDNGKKELIRVSVLR